MQLLTDGVGWKWNPKRKLGHTHGEHQVKTGVMLPQDGRDAWIRSFAVDFERSTALPTPWPPIPSLKTIHCCCSSHTWFVAHCYSSLRKLKHHATFCIRNKGTKKIIFPHTYKKITRQEGWTKSSCDLLPTGWWDRGGVATREMGCGRDTSRGRAFHSSGFQKLLMYHVFKA